MKKIVQSMFIALGFLPFSLLGSDSVDNELGMSSPFAQTRAILQFMQGKNTGGQLDLLIPFYGNDSQFLYTDLQAYKYGQSYQTLSASLGGRSFAANAIYGTYAFYDFQTSPNRFNYHRINLGVERLGETWEWRANVYSYLNNERKINDLGQVSAFVQGNDIKYNHFYEVEQAYRLGGDLEVGRSLGLNALRGYAAYYNYGNEITGGRVRLSYDLSPHWQILATSQYDATRGWLSYGAINYWIGNAKSTTGTALDKLRDPIVRDMTVATKIVDNYNEIDTDTRHIYFANPNDTASLETTLASAKEGDFIYLEEGAYALNNAVNLQSNQTLWGAGADLYANNLLLIPASGTTTLNANNIANLTTPNCGIYVCAVYVTNSGNYGGFDLINTATYNGDPYFVGLLINNNSTVNINTMNISGFTAIKNRDGVGFVINNGNTDTTNLTLSNITANNNNIGLIMYSGNATITGEVNTFNNNTFYGMYIIGGIIQNAQNINAFNNNFAGVVVNIGGNLNGTFFTLNDNGTGLVVKGGTVYLSNSSFDNDNSIVSENGTLTVFNPINLIGTIMEVGANNIVLITNTDGYNYIPTLTNTYSVTCNINNGMGTCQ